MTSIKITKTKNSKLQTTDFENLGFGKVFSDHMLICDYKNGSWGEPEIVPFQPMSLMPSAKIFHYNFRQLPRSKLMRGPQEGLKIGCNVYFLRL